MCSDSGVYQLVVNQLQKHQRIHSFFDTAEANNKTSIFAFHHYKRKKQVADDSDLVVVSLYNR